MLFRSTWYICETTPLGEFRSQVALRRIGIGSYVPVWKEEKRHRRTKKWREREHIAMRGYILIDMPFIERADGRPAIRFDDWMAIKNCEGIKDVLGLAADDGQVEPFAIPSRFVERLISAQANMEWDDTRIARERRGELDKEKRDWARSFFLAGMTVRSNDGPLKRFEGEVTGVTSDGQVKALINLLGRLVPTAFPPDWLEVVEKADEPA